MTRSTSHANSCIESKAASFSNHKEQCCSNVIQLGNCRHEDGRMARTRWLEDWRVEHRLDRTNKGDDNYVMTYCLLTRPKI
jgi:hypothetical protein